MFLSRPFFRVYFPPLFYMAVIFCFSSLESVTLPFLDRPSVDKLYHSLEYFFLGYLILRALEQGWRMQGKKMVILAILLTALYGWSDEIHQLFVPGRLYSYWDLAADTLGGAVGAWSYLKIRL